MQTVLVTGASRGIGAAAARALISKGHRVIGVARHEAELARLRSDNFVPVVGDVRNDMTLARVEKVVQKSGLNGLILNAGFTGPIGNVSSGLGSELHAALQTSLVSPVNWIAALLPQLRIQQGRILYTSTAAVKFAPAGWGLFLGIRGGMGQILASLAKEEPRVTCLSVDPGVVNTAAFQKGYADSVERLKPEHVKWLTAIMAGKRFSPVDAVGEAYAQLALYAPRSKSGTMCTWNEPWIKDLQ